jgi:hypothetical protein
MPPASAYLPRHALRKSVREAEEQRELSSASSSTHAASEMKARQCAKIRELGNALVAAGVRALDEQAKALGLCRSTTWTILRANHKSSGLSATIINRILAARHLHPVIRTIILEYIREKVAGRYGHTKAQLRRFLSRLDAKAFASKGQPRPQEERVIGQIEYAE